MQWPENVRHIAHLSPTWHPDFYSSSRFTLNVTRRDMSMAGYSPSVRLFEAAACGAAIVSDNWPGLDTFFTPGEEILLPVGTEDVVRYLTQLRDEEVRAIGKRAQTRVLAEHTSHQRALEFVREVEAAASNVPVVPGRSRRYGEALTHVPRNLTPAEHETSFSGQTFIYLTHLTEKASKLSSNHK